MRELDRGGRAAHTGDGDAGGQRDLGEQAQAGEPGTDRADSPGPRRQSVGEHQREFARRQRRPVEV